MHQLGAKEGSQNLVKKKVLKTKTFLDEDGFEVTEDVIEEIEVPDEEKDEVQVAVTTKIPEKKTVKVETSKSSLSSGGKQASLTSFFTKKSKE